MGANDINHPTGPFTILELQDQEIGERYLVHERRVAIMKHLNCERVGRAIFICKKRDNKKKFPNIFEMTGQQILSLTNPRCTLGGAKRRRFTFSRFSVQWRWYSFYNHWKMKEAAVAQPEPIDGLPKMQWYSRLVRISGWWCYLSDANLDPIFLIRNDFRSKQLTLNISRNKIMVSTWALEAIMYGSYSLSYQFQFCYRGKSSRSYQLLSFRCYVLC